MTKTDTVQVTWIGPTGHVSKTLGELVPGQTYTVPADMPVDDAFWQRQKPAKAKAEE